MMLFILSPVISMFIMPSFSWMLSFSWVLSSSWFTILSLSMPLRWKLMPFRLIWIKRLLGFIIFKPLSVIFNDLDINILFDTLIFTIFVIFLRLVDHNFPFLKRFFSQFRWMRLFMFLRVMSSY